MRTNIKKYDLKFDKGGVIYNLKEKKFLIKFRSKEME